MKKIIAFIMALTMIFSVVNIYALSNPGEGEELNRPNDSASVLKYADIDRKLYTFYEAENAELFDGATSNADHEGYSGKGAVALTCWSKNPDATPGIKFNVKAITGGAQDIYIGYNNGLTWAQTATLTVNGKKLRLNFPTVEKDIWASYGMIKVNVTLKAGDNEVIIQLGRKDYPASFNIDFVAVSKGDAWKDETKAIRLTIGNKTITKISENGETTVECDVAPVIREDLGLTFIPVRGVFDASGATIEWNENAKAVTVKTAKDTVTVTIDDKQAKVNGKKTMLAGAPFIENGRTFIPLRFISENLGYKVDWNGTTQTITINLSGSEDIAKAELNVKYNSSKGKFKCSVTLLDIDGKYVKKDGVASIDVVREDGEELFESEYTVKVEKYKDNAFIINVPESTIKFGNSSKITFTVKFSTGKTKVSASYIMNKVPVNSNPVDSSDNDDNANNAKEPEKEKVEYTCYPGSDAPSYTSVTGAKLLGTDKLPNTNMTVYRYKYSSTEKAMYERKIKELGWKFLRENNDIYSYYKGTRILMLTKSGNEIWVVCEDANDINDEDDSKKYSYYSGTKAPRYEDVTGAKLNGKNDSGKAVLYRYKYSSSQFKEYKKALKECGWNLESDSDRVYLYSRKGDALLITFFDASGEIWISVSK